jgi:hypothetical protein
MALSAMCCEQDLGFVPRWRPNRDQGRSYKELQLGSILNGHNARLKPQPLNSADNIRAA